MRIKVLCDEAPDLRDVAEAVAREIDLDREVRAEALDADVCGRVSVLAGRVAELRGIGDAGVRVHGDVWRGLVVRLRGDAGAVADAVEDGGDFLRGRDAEVGEADRRARVGGALAAEVVEDAQVVEGGEVVAIRPRWVAGCGEGARAVEDLDE